LAGELGLSPQGLAEILSLRNRPTGEQALRIAEFLNNNTMNTSGSPRTLTAAREKIEALTAELKRLKSPPAAPAKTIAPVPAATLMPAVVAKAATPTLTAMEAEISRAHAARTAKLSALPIELQTANQLRVYAQHRKGRDETICYLSADQEPIAKY
jgi:hypothetical protein